MVCITAAFRCSTQIRARWYADTKFIPWKNFNFFFFEEKRKKWGEEGGMGYLRWQALFKIISTSLPQHGREARWAQLGWRFSRATQDIWYIKFLTALISAWFVFHWCWHCQLTIFSPFRDLGTKITKIYRQTAGNAFKWTISSDHSDATLLANT